MTGAAMPPSVLAATDFGPRSAQVVGRAAALARALGARLVLAHVLPAQASGPALAVDGRRVRPLLARLGLVGRAMSPQIARDRLAALIRDLPADLQAQGRVLHGHPAEALARAAREEGAVLIVLGLHRERRMLDSLRLTTMERTVLAAPAPVLIAHPARDRPYRHILALTDFSPGSAAALAMAARLAPGAAFHAVHALQVPLAAVVADGAAAEDDVRTQAELMRAAFTARADLPRLAEPPVLVPGPVHLVLEFRRRELDADLICIGTHSGSAPDALGHYARDLMRAPPTDLLIAKPG